VGGNFCAHPLLDLIALGRRETLERLAVHLLAGSPSARRDSVVRPSPVSASAALRPIARQSV
jgi:hypothetical protein